MSFLYKIKLFKKIQNHFNTIFKFSIVNNSTYSFDLKSSSWILTPMEIRKLGGALFGDKKYNRTFIYHNGAESYYSNRGFRVLLKI